LFSKDGEDSMGGIAELKVNKSRILAYSEYSYHAAQCQVPTHCNNINVPTEGKRRGGRSKGREKVDKDGGRLQLLEELRGNSVRRTQGQ